VAIHLRELVGKLALSFRHEDFVASIVHNGDFETLIAALAPYPLAAAVPGQEAGVLLADAMAVHLGLPANNTKQSLARRDKYAMHEQIAAAGLRAIDQVCTGDIASIMGWLDAHRRWPVVVKPALSGGTDGVRICDTVGDVEAAFGDAIGQTNLLGFRNEVMIAQEYIDGTEFIVDAVTCDGQHRVVGVAFYRKERGAGGGPIYREMVYIPPREWASHASLLAYAVAVLDALGITFGPSHTEIFVDARGPVLVECGARLCGAMVPLHLEAVTSPSPLELTISSFVDPRAFSQAIAEPQTQHDEFRVYMLRNDRAGRVAALPGDKLLRSLPTVRDIAWYAAEGAEVIETRDLMSGLGLVFLSAAHARPVEADIARIAQWERDNALVTVVN
jgi:L-amino acid ligase